MCYTVPTAAAVITTLCWNKNRSFKTLLLMLMFYGGSLFGVVDHLWNGELFTISANWRSDLCLGMVITAVIFISWKAVLGLTKNNILQNSHLVSE